MADSGPRPKPRPRSLKPQQQAARDKLLASFNGFGASTVSAEHIETAKECIRDGGPPRDRYKFIDFVDILKRNEVCVYVHAYVCVCAHACVRKYV